MLVTKLLISPVKKRIFCPKTTKFGPNFGIFGEFGPGHAGLFDALLVGLLVVVARGLYLARHLFTLYKLWQIPLNHKRKEGSSEGNILPGDSNHPGELYSSMEYQVQKLPRGNFFG